MQEIRLDGFIDVVDSAKNIVITNHTNPDGDAMGSALALKRVLEKLDKKVSVIVPNPYPEFLWHLSGNEEVMIYSEGKLAANTKIESADMIFHLDYNAYHRSADMEQALRGAKGIKTVIDHHQQPESWPDFIYSDTMMSSTCQMIYELCVMMEWEYLLDEKSAACIYTGIVTDTGSFKYSATSARTHEVASKLLDLGVQPQRLHNKVFDSQPVARLRLLGTMLEQMEVSQDKTKVLLYLTEEQCSQLGYEKGITEGFVNYGLSIRGAILTIFLREEDGAVKLSLRSKGEFDVNALARAHFNGGGHKNAAGGRIEMSMSEAITHAKKHLQW
ncbi:bifunctional oligoribonuclease/PAP phosphatase NrnA [Schleiferiaceae bacterium]|nr:DHH family phosphoesterase [Flavobacteriales bacterium]MDC1022274.1 bifunctional oligoribonuclease/PAP phosphatase NrnA [Schleiferiaceae bacterium]|tara:strand:- start:1346 stop:2335 length:990 start_codon:yes stop_codon:yes gene_type:complete